jgi:GTP-binding protein Era
VVGRNAQMIKAVGTEARLDIETLLNCRVYLGLSVCARQDWRNDEDFLLALDIVRDKQMDK